MNKDELKIELDKCLNLSADLYNAFNNIPDQFKHKMDNQETCRDIHDIQNRIMSIAYNNGLAK